VSGTFRKYQYDAMNRVTSETLPNGNTVTYTYGPLGNILSKTKKTSSGSTVSSTSYGYSAGNQLTSVNGQAYTYDANGQPLTLATWSGGTGTMYYYRENGHGDVVAVAAASGNTAAQYSYDAWGEHPK
jgi:YD repeat-containing protein